MIANNTKRLERIKSVMKELKLTQVKLAKDIGVQQSHVSRYLTGGVDVSDGFCYNLILQYGINPRWLEYGEGNMFLDYNNTLKEYPTTEDAPVAEMREEIAVYRKTLNNLNDIVERQNKQIDELQATKKSARDAVHNPHDFAGEKITYNNK